MKKLVPSIIGACALVVAAQANTITPTTMSFTSGISIIYGADLTSGEIHSGDGFTIFDIAGFTGFGAVPANWVASSGLTGSTFGVPIGADNAALTNVTFTYTGSPQEQSIGLLPLGSFVVFTTATTTVTDDWVSRDHLLGTQGVIDGALGPGDRGSILVPAQAPTTNVPDGGSSILLLGSALLGLGLLRRRLTR